MNRKWFAGLFIGLLSMPVLAVAILALTHSFEVSELKTYGDVPRFGLTERSGDSVTLESLRGKVWVASFIFTRCSGQCPLLCSELREIQNKFRFKDKFRLLSISVDPVHDTPQALRLYADRFSADPYKWLFLTGGATEVQSLIQHGFRLASGGEGDDPGADDIVHSSKLVLVDAWGRIRGYYDGTDRGSIKTLMKDARGLIRQAF